MDISFIEHVDDEQLDVKGRAFQSLARAEEPDQASEDHEEKRVRERLAETHRLIVEQLAHSNKALQFFEDNKDSFFAIGNLGPILMSYDLVACGPILTHLFADIPINGDTQQTTDALRNLGENEVKNRWLAFLTRAQELTEETNRSHLAGTSSWILGQEKNPCPICGHTDASSFDPAFLQETIPSDLDALALFLTTERVGKQIETDYEDTWLANNREPTEIDPDIRQEDIQRIFGPEGVDALYRLLPNELQGAIAKIRIIGPRLNKAVEAHGEKHQINLDGGFDKDEKMLLLIISPEQSMERILETLFHELGHAIITGSTPIDRDIRQQFAQSIAVSGHLQPGYASGVYDSEGIERGLEEDFAESARQFFLYPREFQVEEPQRYRTFYQILKKYCPSFNPRELSKRLANFVQNIQDRKAA
ncbi:hypothetical protein KJ673_03630 [Patescibacteria group bacterium]|nr:hypothetical protein [Patescibacteria group bacterium]MBU4453187.1 hypothetical protein [Patescibacteria group bacterium]MCG2687393.1 hypothetical protein [Candidatus Parcubacteria bacterium]